MNKDTMEAMEILYKLESRTSNSREKDIIEWALDELVSNPNPSISLDCKNRAHVIAKFALKTAKSKLKRRLKYHDDCFESDITENPMFLGSLCCSDELKHKIIELEDFLDRISMNEKYKKIIGYLQTDMSVAEISKKEGISQNTANVWINRSRKKAYSHWFNENNSCNITNNC